jgi:hypothetical protein
MISGSNWEAMGTHTLVHVSTRPFRSALRRLGTEKLPPIPDLIPGAASAQERAVNLGKWLPTKDRVLVHVSWPLLDSLSLKAATMCQQHASDDHQR